jgi:hypothetical protein
MQEVPRTYHTEINDILLSAIALTVSNWSNRDKVNIGLEGHGRQDISEGVDTSRTGGMVYNPLPGTVRDKSREGNGLI